MSSPRPTRAAAATAGIAVVVLMVVFAAAGYGLGSLVGAAVPLGLIGLFVGAGAGLALVYVRFRRI